MTTTMPPVGAEVSEWTDAGTPDAYRTVTKRRYYQDDETGGNYVDGYAIQNPDGTLEALAVHAELNVWQHHVHHDWDDELSPVEARLVASKLAGAAAELTQLSLMFQAAAEDVEKWGRS